MPPPPSFSCSPVIREWLWKKAQIEKQKIVPLISIPRTMKATNKFSRKMIFFTQKHIKKISSKDIPKRYLSSKNIFFIELNNCSIPSRMIFSEISCNNVAIRCIWSKFKSLSRQSVSHCTSIRKRSFCPPFSGRNSSCFSTSDGGYWSYQQRFVYRASLPEVFCKNGVLENFAKFTWVFSLIK